MTCPYFCSLRDHHGRSQKLSDQRVLFLLFPTPDRSQMKCRGLFFGEPFFLLRCQRRASFVSFRLIPPPSLAHPNHLDLMGGYLVFPSLPRGPNQLQYLFFWERPCSFLFFPVLFFFFLFSFSTVLAPWDPEPILLLLPVLSTRCLFIPNCRCVVSQLHSRRFFSQGTPVCSHSLSNSS